MASSPYMGKVVADHITNYGSMDTKIVSIPYMGKVEQQFVDIAYFTNNILYCQARNGIQFNKLFSRCAENIYDLQDNTKNSS